ARSSSRLAVGAAYERIRRRKEVLSMGLGGDESRSTRSFRGLLRLQCGKRSGKLRGAVRRTLTCPVTGPHGCEWGAVHQPSTARNVQVPRRIGQTCFGARGFYGMQQPFGAMTW